MKITGIDITPLKTGRAIVRIRTDAGIDGLAEGAGSARGAFGSFISDAAAPVLIGEDPRQIDRHWETLYLGAATKGTVTKLPASIVGVINIALWDILGKDTGLPCHALMGGAARKEMQMYWSVGDGWRKTPKTMLEEVTVGWELGYRAFKIRMGWRAFRQDADPYKDFEMFKLVRDFLPDDIYLGFDVNCGYSVSTAIEQGKRFQDYGRIDHLEEPLPQYDYPGLRQVSDALDVAVATGEQEPDRWRIRDVILLGNPDILQPDILTAGGPSELLRISTLCSTFNKPFMPHCPTAGLNSMASLHLYSTVKNGTRPHEFSVEFGTPLDQTAALYGEDAIPKNGVITLTDKPGLGIELNEKALEQYKA